MNEQPILLMENITKVYSNGFVANQDVFFFTGRKVKFMLWLVRTEQVKAR